MTVRVGVIGTGTIGSDHARRLTHVISGATIAALSDVNPATALEVARAHAPDALVIDSGLDLIACDTVDAVMVTSVGSTHEEFVIAAIAAGKPVFCEKPLANTRQACLSIVDAEVEAGSRLVQVGFMRRYDQSYGRLKQVIDSGRIGAPLIYHSIHRNPAAPSYWADEMSIVDAAPHDIDIARWLLSDEIASVQAFAGRNSTQARALEDPLVLVLTSRAGALVTVETSMNVGYAYDIRGEMVGEHGTASLADPSLVTVRADHLAAGELPVDWRDRFAAAYDAELQAWVRAVGRGEGGAGPTAWDGYAAQVVSEAGVSSLRTGRAVEVELGERPALYATTTAGRAA